MNTTTTDFARFGSRERHMAEELLHAWNENGLPDDFADEEVTIMFNLNSGFVFLTNSEYEAALNDGDKLVSYYTCPNCGNEGFKEEITDNGRDCNSCEEKDII